MAKKNELVAELSVGPMYEVSVFLDRKIQLDENDTLQASVKIKKLTDSPEAEGLTDLWNHATALMDNYYKSCRTEESSCDDEKVEVNQEEVPATEEEMELSEEIINGMSKEDLVSLCGSIPELSEIDTKLKEKTLKALIIDALFSEEEVTTETEEEGVELTEEGVEAMEMDELIELCGQVPELAEIKPKGMKIKSLKAMIIDTLFSDETPGESSTEGEYKDTDWND